MTTEASIQLANEGAGPKVRTLELVEPSAADAAGSASVDDTRHQQVVSIATPRGDLDVVAALPAEAIGLLRSIAEELHAIRMALS